MRSIIDLYVYSACDYFIYLDAGNNRYTRSDSGTPLPSEICEDCSMEIVKYADDFVVPEDREAICRRIFHEVDKKTERQVSVSIGVCICGQEYPLEKMYRDADHVLYQVKRIGKNNYAIVKSVFVVENE